MIDSKTRLFINARLFIYLFSRIYKTFNLFENLKNVIFLIMRILKKGFHYYNNDDDDDIDF